MVPFNAYGTGTTLNNNTVFTSINKTYPWTQNTQQHASYLAVIMVPGWGVRGALLGRTPVTPVITMHTLLTL